MRLHSANPSSVEHIAGYQAQSAIEQARREVATLIHCRQQEVIFTSGATESNNLAIRGAFPALRRAGRPHVVTTAIEHPSILETVNSLKDEGARITILPVDKDCRVALSDVREVVTEHTGLVSVMAANNETGTLQPIGEIGAICANSGTLFHTDFSQATAYIAINVGLENIHLASFSGHKMYGPKGVGALYVRLRKPRVNMQSLIYGGGQERGLRSGTLNTHGIVGLGKAFALVKARRTTDAAAIAFRRNRLEETLLGISGSRINGDRICRLPNTTSISISGIEPLALMHFLRNQVVFSASSACSTEKVETSHVLKAMFGDQPRAREAFRLGLGRYTEDADVDFVAGAFAKAVEQLRSGALGD